MSNITTVGLDLAKNVSHFIGCNQAGKIVRKRMLKRAEILAFFSALPKCVVGIESCASAHY
jgi:transposase